MPKLWFVEEEISIEKAARKRGKIKMMSILAVGTITVLLVAAAIALYAMNYPDSGRLVIDLAIVFLAWGTGRTTGELAGIANR
jgi:uncharacterized membrane protein